jgi:hypothetical protein
MCELSGDICELSGELIGELIGSGDDFARTWTERGRKPIEGKGGAER